MFPPISQQIQEIEEPKEFYYIEGIGSFEKYNFRIFNKKRKFTRKSRLDKGKDRQIYAGKKVKYHKDFLKYYHENYGKNLEFTEIIKERSRESVRKHYRKNSKQIQKERWEITKSNPERSLKERLRVNLRNAFRVYMKSNKAYNSKRYGIDWRLIIEHLKPFPEDISKYHIDHIKPLCSFKFVKEDGTQDLEEIKKAFAPENLRWLLKEENLRKNGQDRKLSIHKNGK